MPQEYEMTPLPTKGRERAVIWSAPARQSAVASHVNRQVSAQIDLLPDTSGIVCLSRRSNRKIPHFNNVVVDGNQLIAIANRSSEIGFGMTEGARRVRD